MADDILYAAERTMYNYWIWFDQVVHLVSFSENSEGDKLTDEIQKQINIIAKALHTLEKLDPKLDAMIKERGIRI
jgi:hypothetical protein